MTDEDNVAQKLVNTYHSCLCVTGTASASNSLSVSQVTILFATQVNSAFYAFWLVNSKAISEVPSTSFGE